MPVAVVEDVDELKHPAWKQVGYHHQGQADVQPPEGDPYELLWEGPLFIRRHLAQSENREGNGEHPKNPHHSGVAVIRGEHGTYLEVADNRKIDEKAEYSSANKIPETDGD